DAATRDMFHWISAMIAAPALVYAGRFFFKSARNALRHGRTNMDVPISLAVTLSYAVSLWETVHHGEHAWFDASVSLLFFLLIGRTLDHVMREKARAAINGL
ncbi:nitrogen fixation protein FixI, partial [Rhizobium leguminosarum]